MVRDIYLRADGNSEIGIGHVIRTLALGKMLSPEFNCTLVTRFGSDFLEREARKANLEIKYLSQLGSHFEEFIQMLTGEELVVLDNYYFDSEYQQSIKKKNCSLVVIDDLHDGHFFADLIINHSPSAKPSFYSCESNTKLLLGLDYALLREPFLSYATKNLAPKETLDHILICFGGSDLQNLTFRYTKDLLTLTEEMGYPQVSVILGPSYLHSNTIREISQRNFQIFKGLDQNEMFNLMTKIDLAIVPASSILLEIIALNKAYITGYYADNQKEIANYFSKLNGSYLGDLRTGYLTQHSIMESWYNKDEKRIDGLSPERILKAFTSQFK